MIIKKKIKVVASRENIGLSGARNIGIRASRGDVIAFLDDDAIAESEWIENLVNTYIELNAFAVGGKILPIWLSRKPDYFPDEIGWLVGYTHKGFVEKKVVEVRNTFGPNMSFKKEVFERVGLFNERLGKKGNSCMQAEEAEFCLRMKNKLGKGVVYNPCAIVYHKIPQSKVKIKMLLKRAFYQGYSKALLKRLSSSPETLATEKSYLKDLFLKYIPKRMKRVYCISELKKLSILVASIFSVGLGFLYGYTKRI